MASIEALSSFPVTPARGVYLYWIPLGAGGSGFVRLNGRIYEAIAARRERRPLLDLHHTALVVSLREGRYVVETMWPSPDLDGTRRGVVVEGPVFAQPLSFTRVFRYEVRCWRDGELPDAGEAVGGPRLVSGDPDTGRLLLSLTPSVPAFTWGRQVPEAGEMWNSNSVISWLLTRSGVDIDRVEPPPGGRAPGWGAGVSVARADPGPCDV